jgi:hypothetical protein
MAGMAADNIYLEGRKRAPGIESEIRVLAIIALHLHHYIQQQDQQRHYSRYCPKHRAKYCWSTACPDCQPARLQEWS